ncbi:farnesol dehydrogenase-like [Ostrinia furnacalis]|uniref:farnesol dehydrogenase-like n=1 Tax=Ostrinia furnacalis TaxID=93504 RepID=UPI00103AB089|nr:farnesol dehydrogenase-like [Ostrinia furnacalis]
MKCWANKVVVVTDCSDEVGINVLERLAKSGMIAIGFGKSDDIVNKTKKKLTDLSNTPIDGKVVLCECDITNLKQLRETFDTIIEAYDGVDVLVNNAYCNIDCLVSTGDLGDFKKVVDININALIACTRLAAGSMIERKTRGHIININDLCAYQIPEDSKKNVFIASKAAITSVNEILRHEFRYLEANIKVTNIACGSIESEAEHSPDEPKLKIRDVAKLVKLILNTPEHLQVHEVLLDSTLK